MEKNPSRWRAGAHLRVTATVVSSQEEPSASKGLRAGTQEDGLSNVPGPLTSFSGLHRSRLTGATRESCVYREDDVASLRVASVV